MKPISIILLLTLTSCTAQQFVERLEYNHERLEKQEAFLIGECDTIKAWKFEDRYEYKIRFFTFNSKEVECSFRSFNIYHKGDTIYNNEGLLSDISINTMR